MQATHSRIHTRPKDGHKDGLAPPASKHMHAKASTPTIASALAPSPGSLIDGAAAPESPKILTTTAPENHVAGCAPEHKRVGLSKNPFECLGQELSNSSNKLPETKGPAKDRDNAIDPTQDPVISDPPTAGKVNGTCGLNGSCSSTSSGDVRPSTTLPRAVMKLGAKSTFCRRCFLFLCLI